MKEINPYQSPRVSDHEQAGASASRMVPERLLIIRSARLGGQIGCIVPALLGGSLLLIWWLDLFGVPFLFAPRQAVWTFLTVIGLVMLGSVSGFVVPALLGGSLLLIRWLDLFGDPFLFAPRQAVWTFLTVIGLVMLGSVSGFVLGGAVGLARVRVRRQRDSDAPQGGGA